MKLPIQTYLGFTYQYWFFITRINAKVVSYKLVNFIIYIGTIHKLRRQDFEYFLTPLPLRRVDKFTT